jgi:hypothetical protein
MESFDITIDSAPSAYLASRYIPLRTFGYVITITSAVFTCRNGTSVTCDMDYVTYHTPFLGSAGTDILTGTVTAVPALATGSGGMAAGATSIPAYSKIRLVLSGVSGTPDGLTGTVFYYRNR